MCLNLFLNIKLYFLILFMCNQLSNGGSHVNYYMKGLLIEYMDANYKLASIN